ncbi:MULTISPECIES: hypothetical protein [Haloferax]|nr:MULTISPECIES: hypothetical protein [Haloferax]
MSSRDQLGWSAIKGTTGLVYLFLLFPLLAVVIISFQPSKYPTFPPKG